MMNQSMDWKIKYRPQSLNELVVPNRVRDQLQAFIDGGCVQNMIFYGPPGVGKTTAARLLRSEENVCFYGCSTRGSTEEVRKMLNSCTSSSLYDRRLIIIDEAELLSKEAQLMLRGGIEKLSANNDFILTLNDIGKIHQPIRSRMELVSFEFALTQEMKKSIRDRIDHILSIEGLKVEDEKAIEFLIRNEYMDMRKLVGGLQRLCYEWRRQEKVA